MHSFNVYKFVQTGVYLFTYLLVRLLLH